jgi:hypothetical protein
MNRNDITALALAHGFKLKEQPDGRQALNAYVFDFAQALIEKDRAELLAQRRPLAYCVPEQYRGRSSTDFSFYKSRTHPVPVYVSPTPEKVDDLAKFEEWLAGQVSAGLCGLRLSVLPGATPQAISAELLRAEDLVHQGGGEAPRPHTDVPADVLDAIHRTQMDPTPPQQNVCERIDACFKTPSADQNACERIDAGHATRSAS